MNRTRKYLIIILILFTALLCAVGASTWIVTNPTPFTPDWGKAIYVKRVAEDDYTSGGIQASTLKEKIEFCDETGKVIETSITPDLTSASLTDGSSPLLTSGTLTVGCTYLLSNITIDLTNSPYYIAGTYYTGKEPLSKKNGKFQNDYIQKTSNDVYTLKSFLYKYKTVDVGGTLYTIEDALAQNGNATVKYNTSFTGQTVAQLAGYSTDKGNYTVSSGKTLLLPFSDTDTEGYIHPTWAEGADASDLPGNANGAKLFEMVTIPSGITVANEGTFTVGAFTGQKGNGHIGGISGGYAQLMLNGTLNSSGTLNVYGNITGEGSVNATGGTVLERMEILDWPGGTVAGARFTARPGQNYSLGIGDILKLTMGGTISLSDPNEFPFEGYQLQAINGPTLTVEYGVTYCGNVRIFTSQQSQMGITVPPMLSIANLNVVNRDNDSADALFKLKNGSEFIKQVKNGREKVTVKNDFIGGKTSISMDLMKASIQMDTAHVKFPISSQIDLTIDGGISSSSYAYEIMEGATVSLINSAQLTLTNPEDGTIAYGGGGISVGKNCSLTISGKFGGKLTGDDGATLNFQAQPSNSGYIAGGGSRDGTTFTFTGDSTTVSAHGLLGPTGTDGNFVQNTTYYYSQNAWRTPSSYTVNYHANANGDNVTGINEANGIHSVTVTSGVLEGAHCDWRNTAPTVISRAYYKFDGWYTDEGCTQVASNSILGGQTLDLYAKWTPINYTVTYVIEGYNGYTLNTSGFTNWTIEKSFDLSKLTPTGLPQGTTFVGWYNDSVFSTQITTLDKENIKYITPFATSITLYGQVNKVVEYTVHYNYGEKPTDDDDNYATGKTGVIGDSAKYKTGSTVNAEYIDALYTDEAANDTNKERQYYFLGWFDEANNLVPSGATIQETMDADSNNEITFTAKWAEKVQVTISGEYTDDTLNGYYRPNDSIDLSKMYESVTVDDYNVEKQQYFGGWSVTSGAGSVVDNTSYTVPADFAGPITITADRADKVKLTVNVTGQSKITLTASNVSGLPENTTVSNKTYYLKPGTIVKYTISSTAQDGKNPEKDGWSAASGEWSIEGAKTGDADEKSLVGSDEFTMPESGTVTVTAKSQNGQDGSCIVEGTLIMMADGTQKPVEEVKAGDEILVFNHETGKYEKGKMWFVDDATQPKEWHTIVRLKFSDGSEIGISYRHGFFDLDLNKYVYIDEMNYSEFIGHRFTSVKQVNGEFVSGQVKLISGSVAQEYVRVFGPISEYHFNMVTDGLLTMPSFNYGETGFFNFFDFGEGMKYDEEKMQADIEKYGLFTYEEFADLITYDIWCKAPMKYLKISIAKGLMTFEDIELTVQWLIDKGFFE